MRQATSTIHSGRRLGGVYHSQDANQIQGDTPMSERPGAITMKGNAMTLVGNEIKVGNAAPDFVLRGHINRGQHAFAAINAHSPPQLIQPLYDRVSGPNAGCPITGQLHRIVYRL